MASSNINRQPSMYQCSICYHSNDLFCVGECNHPVCFECGTRIRVICESHECPLCRLELKQVWITADPIATFSSFNGRKAPVIDKLAHDHGIKFESRDALAGFRDILAHVCTVCKLEPEFPSFAQLNQHMRREHELFYCDLCVDNLRLFSYERKCYSRTDLAAHRRVGDKDDKSHRGHPMCQFCDQRFLDSDYLFRHLRKDHFFCHFCDVDASSNHFYDTYEELRNHFKSDHFLCEEGLCKDEQFIAVFRSEIDFKAHKSQMHSNRKQVLNLEFNYQSSAAAQRARAGYSRDRGGRGRGGRPDGRPRSQQEFPQNDQTTTEISQPQAEFVSTDSRHTTSKITTVTRVIPEPVPHLPEPKGTQSDSEFEVKGSEFPRLGKSGPKQQPISAAYAIRRPYSAKASDKFLNEEFPSLPGSTVPPPKPEKPQQEVPVEKRSENGLVIIDDNLGFPSLPSAPIPAEPPPPDPKPKPEPEETTPSFYQSLTSGAWTQRPGNLGQAVKCLGGEEFPALSGKGKLRGLREAKGNKTPKINVWNKTAKNKENSAKPKVWSEAVTKEKQKIEKKEEKIKPKVGQDQLVQLEAPLKSKARRLAQRNQRTSSESHPDEPPGLALGPPPGLGPSVPPGFEVIPNCTEHKHCEYIRSSNFVDRNRALFEKISTYLQDEKKMADFKTLSKMYKKADVGAEHYYDQVHLLLGNDNFADTFPELLCLLPDIKRQQQLLEVHRKKIENKSGAKHKKGWHKTDRFGNFSICPTCAQVLAENDVKNHTDSHQMNEMFPVLL